jgi:hypothetical protein
MHISSIQAQSWAEAQASQHALARAILLKAPMPIESSKTLDGVSPAPSRAIFP